jgi:hypothetical protein
VITVRQACLEGCYKRYDKDTGQWVCIKCGT